MMQPTDPAGGELAEKSLFEQWMGMTPEEWDALGDDEVADEQPKLI